MLSPDQIEANWNRLCEFWVGAPEREILFAYEQNPKEGIYGFKYAPGSTHYHHAYEGGLVQHLLEMMDFGSALYDHMFSHKSNDPIWMSHVTQAILLHDLHKAYYRYRLSDDGKFAYCENVSTQMFDDNTKSLLMAHGTLFTGIGPFPRVSIPSNVVHALINSEGGYGEGTRETSVLAKFVYVLDELSCVKNRAEQGMWLSARVGKDAILTRDLPLAPTQAA